MLGELTRLLFTLYAMLVLSRLSYYAGFIPRWYRGRGDKKVMKSIRRAFFASKRCRQLRIPFKTHVFPIDESNVVVYDHVCGFAKALSKVLVVPDFGSVHSLTGEITPLLDYYSDVYILNTRICSPFYRSTRPLHSQNIVDIELLVSKLGVRHVLAFGAARAAREYSKCALYPVRIAVVPLEMDAWKLKSFDACRNAHLDRNKLLPVRHAERLMLYNCDCYQYVGIVDKMLAGDSSPQHSGNVKVFDVEEKVRCRGAFQIVCACVWLADVQ